MNCCKVKRLLPLKVGNELPRSKITAIENHLKICPACQEEYDKNKNSNMTMKNWMAQREIQWDSTQWQVVLNNVVEEGKLPVGKQRICSVNKKKKMKFPLLKVISFGLTACIAVGFLMFIDFWDSSVIDKKKAGSNAFLVENNPDSGQIRDLNDNTQKGLENKSVQSITMVLKESGSEIKWYFIKNLNLEEI